MRYTVLCDVAQCYTLGMNTCPLEWVLLFEATFPNRNILLDGTLGLLIHVETNILNRVAGASFSSAWILILYHSSINVFHTPQILKIEQRIRESAKAIL